ncbi:MAG: thiamine diphosphokinase [Defluviitaleaceae bacterium]|nr:thiamine diphosphokinase [Defluviitaleaceae bacterium]
MRACIISGGQVTDYAIIKSLIHNDDTIICADSGYNHAVKMGINPDILVGDFDSIGVVPPDVKSLRFPARKDLTDTEIAIEYARDKGFKDFLLLACTGTRMDHCITNVLLLKGFLERGENAVLQDEHNEIMLTNKKLSFQGAPGDIVSLVPLQTCCGVCTNGLEYPLNEAILYVGKGLGVSNVMLEETASISLCEGLLLIIKARD